MKKICFLLFTFFTLFFLVPTKAHALKLEVITNPVLNLQDSILRVSEIHQCEKNTITVSIHYDYNKDGNSQKEITSTDRTNNQVQWPVQFNLNQDGKGANRVKAEVDIQARCDGPIIQGDPLAAPSVSIEQSPKVHITMYKTADIATAQPTLALSPSAPYKNETTTLSAKNLGSAGCQDGTNAYFWWENTKALGKQKASSDHPLVISGGAVSYDLSKGFDNTDEKTLWVSCNNGSKTIDFPSDHSFKFTPLDRATEENITPTMTPVPPPPPCESRASDGSCNKTDSAIGPLATKPEDFVLRLFTFLLALSGGLAVLLIMAGGYKYMTSQGNPEAVKGAQEMIVSAIAGLLFMIFAFIILQVIGVDILKIPGFG